MSYLNDIKRKCTMTKNNIDILFLSHRYEVVSGGEKALLDMLKYIVSVGIKPHVIIGDKGDITDHLDKIGVPYSVFYLPFWVHDGNDSTPFEFTSLNPTVNTTLSIVKLINKIKPRLCVTNTMTMPWLGYASAITGVNHAWLIHELGTAGFNFNYAIGEDQTLRNIDNLSDKIFYNSKYTASYYLPHFSHNKDASPSIIYPVGSTSTPKKIPSPYKKDALKLVCVGQIKSQKGQLDAVKAVKRLSDKGVPCDLLLIGDVEEQKYKDTISKFISKSKIEGSIRFLGHVSSPSSYVAHADISINCAVNESFGRVTVESMFAKKAVVGANSAGTAEILNSDAHGLLYEPGNTQELSEILERLNNSPEDIKSLGESAYEVASSRFSTANNYSSFVEYYKTLPTEKASLDLSPLCSTYTDFERTLELYSRARQELAAIKNSRLWRIKSFFLKNSD